MRFASITWQAEKMNKELEREILSRRCGGDNTTMTPPPIYHGLLTDDERRAIKILSGLNKEQLNSVSIVVWAIKKAGSKV